MVKIPYMALQTPDLIGRSAEIRAIQEAIGGHGKPTRVLLLIGDGGIGKTRLLKKAFDYAEQQQVRWVDIDLYYPEQHSNSGIERKIRDSLDPHKSAFTKYRRMRTDFQDMRRRQAPPDVLEAMRSQLTDAFVEGFNEISRNERLLLAFDRIWAAAGHPHCVFSLSPQELLAMTGGQVVDVAEVPAAGHLPA